MDGPMSWITNSLLILCVAAGLAAQTPTPPTAADGLAHVAFRVSDVVAVRDYYYKLGFEQSFEYSDAKGITVSYMKVNDRQFIELYRRNRDEEPLGLMHLCFESTQLEALAAVYEGRGLTHTPPNKGRAGNVLFNLQDPERQLLEHNMYLPGSMHMLDSGKHLGATRISDHMVGATTRAKDMQLVRTFYTEKLGAKDLGGTAAVRMLFPGRYGEEVDLEPATPDWKPGLVFGVPDVARAQAELKKRGLAATDPDGVRIIFVVASPLGN